MKTNISTLIAKTSIIVFAVISSSISYSQTWDYDFGTGTGQYTNASGNNNSLVPQPYSGAGTSQLSVGAVSNSSGFYLNNPGLLLLGTGSELKSTASSGVAANKFSIYGYKPTRVFYTRFNLVFGNESGLPGAKQGNWYFLQGSGSLYSDMASAGNNPDQGFVSIKFEYSGSTVKVYYHNGEMWSDISSLLPNTILQGQVYTFEIYANNSLVNTDYFKGQQYLIDSHKWDLWINGSPAITGLTGGGLPAGSDIDSWLFSGEHTTVNSATIFIDDITYSNALPGSTLPVTLVSFNGKSYDGKIILDWITNSEINNDYFTIERSSDAVNFEAIAMINGAGTSNVMNTYSYIDNDPVSGLCYYRLRQTDFDGTNVAGPVISVKNDLLPESLEISYIFSDENGITAGINCKDGIYKTEIISLSGTVVYSDNKTINKSDGSIMVMPKTNERGYYILRITGNNETVSSKFVF